jgi:hypothetical protein
MKNNNTSSRGNTMTQRELTHAETVVETNSKGQQLCRPKYGFRWTIQDWMPTAYDANWQPGWTTCLYIDCERRIRAMWDAHYADK